MTQSAASKALMEIESVMGGSLFERSRVGIVPNELGRCVIRYAWLLRAVVDAMVQEASNIRLGRVGRLSVGAMPHVLTDAIQRLNKLPAVHGSLTFVSVGCAGNCGWCGAG